MCLVCVCVWSGLHKGRQEESRAGSRVKGGAEPGRALGVTVAALAFFLRQCWEGRRGELVLMETSKVTKTDLTGRLNEAAGLLILISLWAPRLLTLLSCYNNLLLLLVITKAAVSSTCQSLMRGVRRSVTLLREESLVMA